MSRGSVSLEAQDRAKEITEVKRAIIAVSALLLIPAAINAATVTITNPAGVFTNPGPVNAGDPLAADQWLRTNVRDGGSVGITGDYPRSGNGSMWFSGPSGAKADAELYFSASHLLSDVSAFSYEWYRDSSSTAPAHYHPALRLFVDADGNIATSGDRGYLVFERAYNPSVQPVPQDTWVTDNALSANLWSTGNLPDAFAVYNRNLSGWSQVMSSARVLGISTGIGSGWAGSYDGAVDNITIGFGGVDTTYNFELAAAPIPEPVFLQFGSLLGMAGMGALRLRRKP